MRKIALIGIVAAMSSAAACDGPRENAGENADFAAGEVASNDTLRQGPAEQLGEAQDIAEKRAREAQEAEARALEAQPTNSGRPRPRRRRARGSGGRVRTIS